MHQSTLPCDSALPAEWEPHEEAFEVGGVCVEVDARVLEGDAVAREGLVAGGLHGEMCIRDRARPYLLRTMGLTDIDVKPMAVRADFDW